MRKVGAGGIWDRIFYADDRLGKVMLGFLLWLLLFFFCWPLALLALILYPLVWLVLLPLRILGLAVEGVFELLRAIIFFPARVLGGGRR